MGGDLEAWMDRRVSPAMLSALLDREGLGLLIEVRNQDPSLLDVVLVYDSKSRVSRAILYMGLTKLVDLEERGGRFKLCCRRTEVAERYFKDAWRKWQVASGLVGERGEIFGYLDEAARVVPERSIRREGAVQGAICSGLMDGIAVITREAIPQFTDEPARQRWRGEIEAALIASLDRVDDPGPWWPTTQWKALGLETDVLAVDPHGDLLVIEVKPAQDTPRLVRGPVQVRAYAELWARLLATDQDAVGKLNGMLAQRRSLGLSPSDGFELRTFPRVVPVLAIGEGRVSPAALPRMRDIAGALPPLQEGGAITPTRVWGLNGTDGSGAFRTSDLLASGPRA